MAKIPEKVGKYKILGQIGKGGMGVVYTAMHPTLKRKVILKKLTIRDKEFRERFRLEADVMMDLRSDYIVDMYDHFKEGRSWYIAMEYIEGITLAELIAGEAPLDFTLIAYILYCTAAALEYIHGRGIVHRDIKPSNIYLSRSGEVKLGDFGIASASDRDVNITDSGSAMGTPAYMAPEQFDDSSAVGKEADLFSFGVTIYEAVTGSKPFRANGYTKLKKEIRRGKYTGPTRFRKKIPLYLRWMIRRCLVRVPFFRLKSSRVLRRRFARELGRRGISSAREQLSSLLAGKRSRGTIKNTTDRKTGPAPSKRIILIFLIAFALVFPSSVLLYFTSSYGRVSLRIVPSDDGSRYTLFPLAGGRSAEGRFGSDGEKRLFLREGSYRLEVESGSSQQWRSFYVSPLRSGREELSLTFLTTPRESLPVHLDLALRDRFSGEDLLSRTEVFLEKSGEWVPLNEELRQSLRSGRILKLRFTADGYREENFILPLEFGQTDLKLDVLLTPVPARLIFPPGIAGNILLNGSPYYFSPDTLKREKAGKKKKEEKMVLSLLPGHYDVSLDGGSNPYKAAIDLKSGSVFTFDEDFGKD